MSPSGWGGLQPAAALRRPRYSFVGQVANLRTDCQLVHPGESPDMPRLFFDMTP
jgi:hypothetical protein